MFQNKTEIIKNFFFVLFYTFTLLLFRLLPLLSPFTKPAFSELSFSDLVSVCMAALQS